MKVQHAAIFALMMGCSFAGFAAEDRMIEIKNTDDGWANGTIDGNGCYSVYNLKSATLTAFGPLTIVLRFKKDSEKEGGDSVLEVQPFGGSKADESIDTTLEGRCSGGQADVVRIVENQNGRMVDLPLSVIRPVSFKPTVITVGGKSQIK
ncbi:MAG: IrmA family protein [Plesiomonas shigelloides]